MSLQRGEDIKGWEGVTRGLATSPDERQAWNTWTLGLLFVLFMTGLVALLLSQSDIPVFAKALMTGLAIPGILMLMSGGYTYLVKHARKSGDEAKPASKATPTVARKTAPATIEPAAAPATPPIAKQAPEPAPVPEPVHDPVAEAIVAPEPVTTTETVEDVAEQSRPEALDGPRDGGEGDDLTLIKGVGPALKALCNKLGFWHFDQIASWTDTEVAWVDQNLEGFKGRVTRDDWVSQAKILAAGGETEFSKRQ